MYCQAEPSLWYFTLGGCYTPVNSGVVLLIPDMSLWWPYCCVCLLLHSNSISVKQSTKHMQWYSHHRSTSRRKKLHPNLLVSSVHLMLRHHNLAICDGRTEYTDETSLIHLIKENKMQLQYINFIILWQCTIKCKVLAMTIHKTASLKMFNLDWNIPEFQN